MSETFVIEYFELLTLECEFIEAGFDLIAARSMAIDELQRRKNEDTQFDAHRSGEDWTNG